MTTHANMATIRAMPTMAYGVMGALLRHRATLRCPELSASAPPSTEGALPVLGQHVRRTRLAIRSLKCRSSANGVSHPDVMSTGCQPNTVQTCPIVRIYDDLATKSFRS